jgi:hypothetical protein
VTVYAMTRRRAIISAGMSVILAVGFGFVAVSLVVERWDRWDDLGDVVLTLWVVAFGCLFAVVAVHVGRVAVQSLSILRDQPPYFRIDERGIECARGRFSWSDIEHVVQVYDEVGESGVWSLIFTLRPGSTGYAAEATYLDGYDREEIGQTRLTNFGLEATVPGCRKQALAGVLRYHGATPAKTTRSRLLQEDRPS